MKRKNVRDIEKYEWESGQITCVVEHLEKPLYVMLATPFPDAPYISCPMYVLENHGLFNLKEGELLVLHYENYLLMSITRLLETD